MRRPWTWSMDFVARLPMSQARLRDISVAQTLGTITFAIYDSAEPRPRFIIILVGQRFAFHAWIFRRLLARSAPHEASFFNIFPSSFLPIERGEVSLSYFRFWPKTSSILCWVCDVVTSWVHFCWRSSMQNANYAAHTSARWISLYLRDAELMVSVSGGVNENT